MGRITPYRNRAEAGELLAALLQRDAGRSWVVAAIPRGGVPVAWPIAERLHAPLTLSFAHKLLLPGSREMAVGAVDEDGVLVLDNTVLDQEPLERLAEARRDVVREIERQRELYPAWPLEGFLPAGVILVDDGIATGLTMQAAIAHARRHGAREVVVATPCASSPAAHEMNLLADRFVCPWVEPTFMAVGEFYMDFHQVSDREVVDLLTRARPPAVGGQPAVGAGSI